MSKRKGPRKYTNGNYKVGYKKPPKETQWKKGQSGNPNGGKLHDPLKKQIKKLSQQELAEAAEFVFSKTKGELKEFIRDDEENVFLQMVAAVAGRVISKGDMLAFDTLLNRLLGKVKNQVDLSGLSTSSGAQVVISLPSNGRESLKEPADQAS